MLTDTDLMDRMSSWRKPYTLGPEYFTYTYAIMPRDGDPRTGTMHAPSDKEARTTVTEYAIRLLHLSPTGLNVTVERQPDEDDPYTPI